MTPDYYPVLRKAIAGADHPDEATRQALYQRARQALANALRSADPPLRDAEIDIHADALDAAVARIESEFADPTAQNIAGARTSPAGDRTVPTGRRRTIVTAGALALLTIAGVGAYFFAARDRAGPAPTGHKEQPRPSATQTPDGSGGDSEQASYILRQQRVYFRTTHPVGSVVVSRNQRFLYVVQPNQVAIRYAIGVGPDCESIAGLFRVTGKVNPPAPGQTDESSAPSPSRAGGRERPGAAFDPPAIYFGGAHAVHRAREPARIGQAATIGCFQAWARDMTDLYERVAFDQRVVVAN